MSDKEKGDVTLGPVTSTGTGEMAALPGNATKDAVFGEIAEGGPNYRNVGWMGTAVLMLKLQIGLGVLSIPLSFNSLGLIPGLLVLFAIAAITTWSDYLVGTFKMKHPEVYGIDDVGGLMFGRVGRVVFGFVFCLFLIFIAGSGMLSISISLNALSDHGTCTAVFVAVAAVIAFVLASIRTLGRLSWLAWIGIVAILSAIFTLTVAVGVQERPAAAPQTGPFVSNFKIIGNPTWTEAITAVSTIVFAYAGTPAFFAVVSEMRDPRLYTRSLLVCQGTVTVVYSVIGIVVYYYCGSYVASPALGSAGPIMKKVCYGLALPGLIVTTTLMTHISAKFVLVRILGGSRHLNSNSIVHWCTWLCCTFGTVVISYIIASAIPVFGGLVSLIGALLGTSMSFQPMGFMWLYDNWGKKGAERDLKWKAMVCWVAFVIVSGTFLMVGGTYGSVVSIIQTYQASGGSAEWSCADNSGSS